MNISKTEMRKQLKRLRRMRKQGTQVSMTSKFCGSVKMSKVLSMTRPIKSTLKKKEYSQVSDLTSEYKNKFVNGYTPVKQEIKTGTVTELDKVKIGYVKIEKKR